MLSKRFQVMLSTYCHIDSFSANTDLSFPCVDFLFGEDCGSYLFTLPANCREFGIHICLGNEIEYLSKWLSFRISVEPKDEDFLPIGLDHHHNNLIQVTEELRLFNNHVGCLLKDFLVKDICKIG